MTSRLSGLLQVTPTFWGQTYLLMFMLQWLPVKVLLVEAARREVLSFFPWAFFISL